jgi:hypothetical protein
MAAAPGGRVQIIESSVLGLRAARWRLKRPDSEVEVTLFPMVHVGEPGFFREVYDDAFAHDVALTEGVNSPIVRRLTLSYRWMLKSPSLGLVMQPRTPPDSRARIVHADLTAEELAAAWRKIPLWLRLLLGVYAPYLGFKRRWFATRESLAKDMGIDDAPSLKELLGFSPEADGINEVILATRDRRLIERLDGVLEAAAGGPTRIAVVYGAAHMRAVIRHLTLERGFRIEDGRWNMVFSL